MVAHESYRLLGGDIAHVERYCTKPTKIFLPWKGECFGLLLCRQLHSRPVLKLYLYYYHYVFIFLYVKL